MLRTVRWPPNEPAGESPACCAAYHHSRRSLLAAAGALSVTGLASSGARASGAAGRIDVHAHFIPPAYLRDGPPAVRMAGDWSPALALEDMDQAGVGLSVLSFSSPYIWFPGIEPGRRLARMCNDYGAGLVRDHPGRFGLFAGVPPLADTDGCLSEIEYALERLRAEGVTLMTNYADKWLGDPAFAPVFEELNRRSAVVFVHPAIPACCAATVPGVSPAYVELPFDTARAILSLWYNGALERWPRIRFIFSHSGGALPMVADRIDKLGRPVGDGRVHDGRDQFRRLYFDTANGASPPALAGIRTLADPSHILFGSDYPYVPLSRGVDDLARAPLGRREREAIERGNAVALMPALATAGRGGLARLDVDHLTRLEDRQWLR